VRLGGRDLEDYKMVRYRVEFCDTYRGAGGVENGDSSIKWCGQDSHG
jgi:hypothetical protein